MLRSAFWSPRSASRTLGRLSLVGFVAVGCAAGSAHAGNQSAPNGAQRAATIEIASFGALTGPDAVYGVSSLNGQRLAVDEINAAGGINGRKLALVQYDDLCEPTQAAIVASKIISNKSFTAAIGPVCSADALAALPIFARTGVPLIMAGDSAPQITAMVKEHGYTFATRLSPQDSQNGPELATLAIRVLHKTKIAILYSEDDYGQGVLAAAKSVISQLGGSIVAQESYTPSTTKDFTPQLTKIAGSGPDVLLLLGYYSDTGIAVSQLARAGVSPKVTVIGSDSTAQQPFVTLAGPAANGVYLVPFYSPNNPSAVNRQFVTAYEKAYGSAPTGNAVMGYQAVYTLANAMKAGGSSGDLAERIRAIDFEGPAGTVDFDANGDLKGNPATVLRVSDGKLVADQELTTALEKALKSD